MYGALPFSYDWPGTHAKRGSGVALRPLNDGEWPPANVVSRVFVSRQEARDSEWSEGRKCSRADSAAGGKSGPLLR
jgi:hypothetical protein